MTSQLLIGRCQNRSKSQLDFRFITYGLNSAKLIASTVIIRNCTRVNHASQKGFELILTSKSGVELLDGMMSVKIVSNKPSICHQYRF